MNSTQRRLMYVTSMIVLALPALYQLGLLFYTISQRVFYPYDLEWMEGGVLVTSQRLNEGAAIYPEPSVEFIPFLYTPLYPVIVATIGKLIGISYALGRVISIVSLVWLFQVLFSDLKWRLSSREQHLAILGSICAMGVIAATYPYVEAWYDIVRADTLFVAMAFTGLILLRRWAQLREYENGGTKMFLAASLLALSFFCKQTGVLFVIGGGGLLLVYNFKRLPFYVLVTGVIGLGGTLLINSQTDGWFWTYVFEVHQAHDFNMDRFWDSFGHMLMQFPVLSYLVGFTLVFTAVTVWTYRRSKQAQRTFFVWCGILLLTLLIGALGISTQWSHKNAYIPAFIGLAGATGASFAAIYQNCRFWRIWVERELRWRLPIIAVVSAMALVIGLLIIDIWRTNPLLTSENRFLRLALFSMLAGGIMPTLVQLSAGLPRHLARQAPLAIVGVAIVAVGLQLLSSTWEPHHWIPRTEDKQAGDNLVAEIKKIDGEVWVPWHPWYAHLAGKPVFTHRMGLLDMRQNWRISELEAHLREKRFAAIILDREAGPEFAPLRSYYQVSNYLTKDKKPKVYTGARTAVPKLIYVPIKRAAPDIVVP